MNSAMSTIELPLSAEAASSTRSRKVDTSVPRRVVGLVEAAIWNQPSRIREEALALAEVLEPSHPAQAKRVRERIGSRLEPVLLKPPGDLVVMETPRVSLSDVVLSDTVRRQVDDLLFEYARRGDLAAAGLSPRHKILLHGEPGNGKTMLAEALAAELDCPFLRANYSGIVDSHLGESGKNLQRLMEYAGTSRCVLFMDEFDGLGIERAASSDGASTENRRVTNLLLTLLDRLSPDCVLVAATNVPDLLDRALRRRFDLTIEICAPDDALRGECIGRCFTREADMWDGIGSVIRSLVTIPFPNLDAVVQTCKRVRREYVLRGGSGIEVVLADARRIYCSDKHVT